MDVKNYYISEKIKMININDITLFKHYHINDFNECDVILAAKTLQKNGIFKPLLVRNNINNKEKYILVTDFLIYLALIFLNVEKVPVIILSLTDAESGIYDLINLKTAYNIHFFTEAKYINFLLKKGWFKKSELAEKLSVSAENLNKKLLLLNLKSEEQSFIKSHFLSEKFALEFLNLNDEQKENVKNEIIIKKLENLAALEFIKEIKKPKQKKIKNISFSNDTVILNSLERVVDSLSGVGIEADFSKISGQNETKYIITLKNGPTQLKLRL